MTPISELPFETYALVAGCVQGHSERVMAVLKVVYEGIPQQKAANEMGIHRSTVQRDCARFREVAKNFEISKIKNREAVA